jgi:hypothetical protein
MSLRSAPCVIGIPKFWHLSGGNRHQTVSVPAQRHNLAEPNRSTGVQKTTRGPAGDLAMNQIIYLIGLVVVIMAILSFLGLR